MLTRRLIFVLKLRRIFRIPQQARKVKQGGVGKVRRAMGWQRKRSPSSASSLGGMVANVNEGVEFGRVKHRVFRGGRDRFGWANVTGLVSVQIWTLYILVQYQLVARRINLSERFGRTGEGGAKPISARKS